MQGLLDESILHSGYSQHACSSTGLGYLYLAHRQRRVSTFQQLLPDLGPSALSSGLSNHPPSCHRHPALLCFGAPAHRPASCCLFPVPPTSVPCRPLMGVGLTRRDLCRLGRVLSRVLPATLPGKEVLLSPSVCNFSDHRGSGFPIRLACSALQWLVKPPTMASADFCLPIPPPYDAGSQWQVGRSPRVMHATFTLIPAASTSAVPVQVPGFEDIGLLTHCDRLLCDFCSSSQCFAFSFPSDSISRWTPLPFG